MSTIFDTRRLKKYLPFKGSLWITDDLVKVTSSGQDEMGVEGGGSLIGVINEYTGPTPLGIFPSRSDTRGVSIADNG